MKIVKGQTAIPKVVLLDRENIRWASLTGEVTENAAIVEYVTSMVVSNVEQAVDAINGQINLINDDISAINTQIVDINNIITNNFTALDGRIDDLTAEVAAEVARIDAAIGSLQDNLADEVAAIGVAIGNVVANFDAIIQGINTTIAGINAAIDEIHTSISAVDADLNAKIDLINAAISGINTHLSAVDADLSSIHAEINGIHSDVTTVNAAIDGINQDIADMDAALNGRIDEANTAISDLEVDINEKIDVIDESITNINWRLDNIDLSITGIHTQIGGISSNIANIEGDITAINADLTGVHTQIGGISSGIASIEGDITAINADLTGVHTQIGGISSNIASIEGDISDIEDDISAIHYDIAGVNSSIATIQGDISDIGSEITDIENAHAVDMAAVNSHFTTVDGRLNVAETNIGNVQQNITSLNTHLNTIDTTLSSVNLNIISVNAGMAAINDEIGDINVSLADKVDKVAVPLQIYGTNANGDQTSYSFESLIGSSSGIANILNSIDEINAELGDITADASALEARVDGHDTDLNEIKEDITEINESISVIETDIVDIEGDVSGINAGIVAINNQFADYALKANLLTLVRNVEITSSNNTVSVNKQVVNSANGNVTSSVANLPIASSTAGGIMPKESFSQIQQNTADIQSLKGANKRYAVNDPLPSSLSQSQVQAIFDAVSGGKTETDGDTLISFHATTLNYGWSYFASDSSWHFRGVDTVMQATQSELGIVKGADSNGKIFVESDGTMSLVGYDGITSSISAINSGYLQKVSAANILYGTNGSGGQQNYLIGTDIPKYNGGKLTSALPSGSSDVANKQYVDNMFVTNGLSADEVTIHLEGSILGFASSYKSKIDGIAAGANNYSLPTATSTVKGGVALFSDTVQSVAASAVTTTASRTYGVQLNAGGQAVVNVPWSNTTYAAATTSASGLMSAADKTKLDGIAASANNYTHPSATALSSGLYKITVNNLGHVTAGAAVAKADITGLGIPAQDTTYTISSTGSGNAVTSLSISASTITMTKGDNFLPSSKMQVVAALPGSPASDTFYFIPE
jgi:predicted  nucleic acid-binding Zn-ribbon protein